MNAKEARSKACLLFALYRVLCVKVLQLFLATVLPFEIRFLSTFLPSAALTSSKGSRIHWTAGGHPQLDEILSKLVILIHFAPLLYYHVPKLELVVSSHFLAIVCGFRSLKKNPFQKKNLIRQAAIIQSSENCQAVGVDVAVFRQRTIYSATLIFAVCRNLVREIWLEKSG